MAAHDRGVKIFLQYWLLIALLGGFNLYWYFRNGRVASLVVAIACAVAFTGWVLFYYLYVRKNV